MTIANTIKPYISVGQQKRMLFEDIVDDFFLDFDTHLYIRGQAGVGKTFTVLDKANQHNTILCHIEGNITRWLFMKKLAVYLYNAGWPSADMVEGRDFEAEEIPKIVVYIDDCPAIFNGDFIDTMKIALEQESSDKLVYNSSLGAQYKQSEEFEKEAIDHFRKSMEPGFTIPFYGRVKFIFTMNHALANEIDVAEAKASNKSMKIQNDLEDRYAIFSRLQYEDLYMDKNEYWGWIADLVLNTGMLPQATQQDKEEMLGWLYDNWTNLKDKSVRMVKQKLWKDLSKAKSRPGHDYRSRWQSLVKMAA